MPPGLLLDMVLAFEADYPASAGAYADWRQDNGFIRRELALRVMLH
jgi:hypothetical protein